MDDLTEEPLVLTKGVVAFPTLQLSVALGRLYMEGNGVQTVDIYHDPRLSKERLFMPEEESPYYIKPAVLPSEPCVIPYFSKFRTKFFSFYFSPRSDDRTLIYSAPAYDGETAKSIVQALSKKLSGEARSRPYEVLHMLVCAIGRLIDWPQEIPLKGPWEMIEIRMGSGLVAAIADATGLSFTKVTDRECLIAQVPIVGPSTATL